MAFFFMLRGANEHVQACSETDLIVGIASLGQPEGAPGLASMKLGFAMVYHVCNAERITFRNMMLVALPTTASTLSSAGLLAGTLGVIALST